MKKIKPEEYIPMAKWRKNKELQYVIPCGILGADGLVAMYDFMTEMLGYIRKKNDGRFEWFIKPSRYSVWPVKEAKQGVCLTEEEAVKTVESQWMTL